MSREAIAAALARVDLSCGERLVAFSLASFADRENRARPGTPAAAGRAGLARSRFLEARERLVRRGLVAVEDAARGRGRASTVALPFAETGPWWEGEINAELFEAVLGYSPTRGPARLLLAAMAALADEHGVLESVSTEQLCAAAGVADRTYRRARATLLASGEVILRSGSGGRGNTNCWELPNPRTHRGTTTQSARGRRVPPPAGTRPLMGTFAPPAAGDEHDIEALPAELVPDGRRHSVGDGKGGQDRTVSVRKGPALTGDSAAKGGQDQTLLEQNRPALSGVVDAKGGQDRTVSRETPAKTPAQTPAPNARAGREPQNPRTGHPPNPPQGGGSDHILVEETYLTERGRNRRRLVTVDLAAVRSQLRAAGREDRAAWEQIRELLLEAVAESTFAIWLDPLHLLAVDLDGMLLVAVPEQTGGWVRTRFDRLLVSAADRAGRTVRFASEAEHRAFAPLPPASGTPGQPAASAGSPAHQSPTQRVSPQGAGSVSGRAGRSSGSWADTSAYPCFYTDAYTETKEVSS